MYAVTIWQKQYGLTNLVKMTTDGTQVNSCRIQVNAIGDTEVKNYSDEEHNEFFYP
jgi:predicted transcriptional regulator